MLKINSKLFKIVSEYKNNDYTHLCFKVSMEILIKLAENKIFAILVHANITIEHDTKGHAWIEYDDYIIDLTQPLQARIMKIEDFYEQAKIKRFIKYTLPEIQNESVK